MASSNHDAAEANFFMEQAIHVAKAALDIGEVPVGCVIVLSDGISEPKLSASDSIVATADEQGHDNDNTFDYKSSPSVIISHGANQVNATRDATRHAEVVAIDRLLTRANSSDRLKLPADVIRKSAHGKVPESYSPDNNDYWVNVPEEEGHWKNGFGWGSGKIHDASILEKCDLYVTCEPCIMVSDDCELAH
jgi:tRNA(Arg) A34 adenosine deaminase TadA